MSSPQPLTAQPVCCVWKYEPLSLVFPLEGYFVHSCACDVPPLSFDYKPTVNEFTTQTRVGPTLLPHGGGMRTYTVSGRTFRYSAGDAVAWAYDLALWLSETAESTLYFPNCYIPYVYFTGLDFTFKPIDTWILGGLWLQKCLVEWQLTAVSCNWKSLALGGSAIPAVPTTGEYAGKNSNGVFTLAGITTGGYTRVTSLRIGRDAHHRVIPRAQGARRFKVSPWGRNISFELLGETHLSPSETLGTLLHLPAAWSACSTWLDGEWTLLGDGNAIPFIHLTNVDPEPDTHRGTFRVKYGLKQNLPVNVHLTGS